MNMEIQALTLTTPELAILIHYLVGELLPLNRAALDDLSVDQTQLAQVQTVLEADGLLVYTPGEDEPGIAGPAAILLNAMLSPERLCVLRMLDRLHEKETQVVFSWAGGLIVGNYVDAAGQHCIYELPNLGALVETMLSTTVKHPAATEMTQLPQSLAALVTQAQLLVILVAVKEPARPETAVESFSWLQTEDGLWLVDGASSSIEQVRPVNRSALRQRILTTVQSL